MLVFRKKNVLNESEIYLNEKLLFRKKVSLIILNFFELQF